jgi:hypothetical protein
MGGGGSQRDEHCSSFLASMNFEMVPYLTLLRTDGDFCHQWWDTEIFRQNLRPLRVDALHPLWWDTTTACRTRARLFKRNFVTNLTLNPLMPRFSGLQVEGVLAYFTHLKCQKHIGDDVDTFLERTVFRVKMTPPDTFYDSKCILLP